MKTLITLTILVASVSAQSLPKSFVVEGVHWQIIYSADEKIMGGADGLTEYNNIVYIRQGLRKEQEKEVLMHELFHAAINSTKASFICRQKWDEHEWIYKTEPRLFEILHNNPELLKYFGK